MSSSGKQAIITLIKKRKSLKLFRKLVSLINADARTDSKVVAAWWVTKFSTKWGSTGALKVRTGGFESKVKLKYETEKYICTKKY